MTARQTQLALGTGLLEELLARLVIFRLLACAFGRNWALALSALLFGGVHLGNDNASLFAAVAIALEAGLMLAGFHLLTGRIWMSVGARVSGLTSTGSFLVSAPVPGTSTLMSGGAFGPEASATAVLVGGTAFLVTLSMLNKRKRRDPGTLQSC